MSTAAPAPASKAPAHAAVASAPAAVAVASAPVASSSADDAAAAEQPEQGLDADVLDAARHQVLDYIVRLAGVEVDPSPEPVETEAEAAAAATAAKQLEAFLLEDMRNGELAAEADAAALAYDSANAAHDSGDHDADADAEMGLPSPPPRLFTLPVSRARPLSLLSASSPLPPLARAQLNFLVSTVADHLKSLAEAIDMVRADTDSDRARHVSACRALTTLLQEQRAQGEALVVAARRYRDRATREKARTADLLGQLSHLRQASELDRDRSKRSEEAIEELHTRHNREVAMLKEHIEALQREVTVAQAYGKEQESKSLDARYVSNTSISTKLQPTTMIVIYYGEGCS